MNELERTQFARSVFEFVEWLLLLVGLLCISKMIMTLLSHDLIQSEFFDLNPWVKDYFRAKKKIEIFQYILNAVFVFLFFASCFFTINRRKENDFSFHDVVEMSCVVGALTLIHIATFRNHIYLATTLFAILLWCFTYRLVLLGSTQFIKGLSNFIKKAYFFCQKNAKKLQWLIVLLILTQLILTLSFFIFKPVQIMNEYLGLPEKTILNNQLVDNHAYINKHRLFGNIHFYDVTKSADHQGDAYQNCIKITGSQHKILEKVSRSNFNNMEHYNYYLPSKNEFCLSSSLVEEQFVSFIQNGITLDTIQALIKLSDRIRIENDFLHNRSYTLQEKDFIKKNKKELFEQIYNRFSIHENNHFIAPMLAKTLGKESKDIFFQYGEFSSELLAMQAKMFGGFQYGHIIKILYSYYLIYELLILGFLIAVFKKPVYVIIGMLLTVGSIAAVGFDFNYAGPGHNPIRHFFDIPLLYCAYYYFDKRSKAALGGILLFAILSLWDYFYFGIFLTLSIMATLIIFSIQKNHVNKLITASMVICLFLAIACFYFVAHSHVDFMSNYFLNGLLGFPLIKNTFYIAFVIYGLGYFLFIKSDNLKGPLKYLMLSLLMYSQGLLLYYIWQPERGHFYGLAQIHFLYILSLAICLNETKAMNEFLRKFSFSTMMILLICSVGFYISAFSFYYSQQRKIENIFKTHQTYLWAFKTAQIYTTMPEAPFKEATNLIQKYASNNGIYLISQYDNILPLLAYKYNELPYFDLPLYILSKKELDNVISIFDKVQPKIIFVDTNINHDYRQDVISNYAGYFRNLSVESIRRVNRMNQLRIIFYSIEKDYRPIAKTSLITVYERKAIDQVGHP